MDAKLFIDGNEVVLNEFVKSMLSGVLAGALTALRGVEEDWREVRLEVTRAASG